jgi:hypothetical protein
VEATSALITLDICTKHDFKANAPKHISGSGKLVCDAVLKREAE